MILTLESVQGVIENVTIKWQFVILGYSIATYVACIR